MTRTSWILAIALGAATVLSGCASFRMTRPANFVEPDDEGEDFDYRITSAHGAVVSVAVQDNDPEGSLQFWVDAIRNTLRARGGYELRSTQEVRAASGQRGTQMRFALDVSGHPHDYWVTIFVTDDDVYLIEAGGTHDAFAPDQRQIERAITSFRIR